MAEAETVETLRDQRDRLRKRSDALDRRAVKPAAGLLLLLAVGTLALWFVNPSSMLMPLTGVALMAGAVLLYFLSPERYIRAGVANALALSCMRNTMRLLSTMLIEAKGTYLPASAAGPMRVFFPLTGSAAASVPDPGLQAMADCVFVVPGAGRPGGLLLEPPGYGLLAYSKQIGARFTDDGLPSEITDVLEKGLELAGDVSVERQGDAISMRMSGIDGAGLCEAIRKENPAACSVIGCPVCSFVACAIVEGTRRPVRIETVEAGAGWVKAVYRIL